MTEAERQQQTKQRDDILMDAPSTGESLYISGVPYLVRKLGPQAEEVGIMGACDPKRCMIWLHLDDLTPRKLRAVIHEILHALAESYRLGLEHDTIRRLSTGLDVTLRDSRNHTGSLGHLF